MNWAIERSCVTLSDSQGAGVHRRKYVLRWITSPEHVTSFEDAAIKIPHLSRWPWHLVTSSFLWSLHWCSFLRCARTRRRLSERAPQPTLSPVLWQLAACCIPEATVTASVVVDNLKDEDLVHHTVWACLTCANASAFYLWTPTGKTHKHKQMHSRMPCRVLFTLKRQTSAKHLITALVLEEGQL